MAHLSETLARRRALAQRLAGMRDTTPAALVSWLGAVQSQDYPLGKWSIAQRLTHDMTAVESAVASGTILRTHVLRPTWHFVPRDDLRWMQALTSARVVAQMRPIDRRHGIDAALIATAVTRIAGAIERRGHLTRREIGAVLPDGGIKATPWVVGELLMHAELGAVVCSGVPRGGQQTYALVDERAPRSVRAGRDESLAMLAERYFQSHGPATVKDFRWWSGIDAAGVARAIEILGARLERIRAGDRTYFVTRTPVSRSTALAAHLIQPYDEIAVGYSESRDVIDAGGAARARGGGLLLRGLLVDGQLAGRWEATAPRRRAIRVEPFRAFTAREQKAVARAAEHFANAFR
jgi:hypothetical protein